MSKIVSDSAERQLALRPDRSFICEAPAGSGKTELLTQRFLTLLAGVKKPEEILAITFTRKAAGEMQDRIVSALKNALENPCPAAENEARSWQLARQAIEADARQQWQILATPTRLQIMTFDSLCAGLALSLPMYSSFAAPPPTSDDASELYLRAAQNFIASMEEPRPWSAALARVLLVLDNNMQKFERLLVGMLAKRDAWLPMLGSGMGNQAAINSRERERVLDEFEAHLYSIHRDTVARLRAKISPAMARSLSELLDFAASNLRRAGSESPLLLCEDMQGELPGDDEEAIPQWLAIAHLLLTAEGEWRKQISVRIGFPPGEGKEEKQVCKAKKEQLAAWIELAAEHAGLQDLLIEIRNLPARRYSATQKKLLSDLLDILPLACIYLKLVFQEKNQVDFTEVSMQALHALGAIDEPSELALAMDFKIQHILVDEFQDTSPNQIELLQRLTAGWQPGDGRSLFCVGDAMQSIYSFRDANVGLFLNCLAGKLGDVPLQPIKLRTNFRSDAALVNWVNRVFSLSFPQENDPAVGAVVYSDSDPFHREAEPQTGEPKISFDVFVGANAAIAEAEHVVAQVQALLSERAATQEKNTIAILVRNRRHLQRIVRGLKNAAIRYRAVELESLADQAVIEDLMALTLALLSPAERIAWLAILRAPWCALSLRDLEIIANYRAPDARPLSVFEQAQAVFWQQKNAGAAQAFSQSDLFSAAGEAAQNSLLSRDGMQRLSRVMPLLQLSLANRQRKSLRQWVEGCWLLLGGPACLQSDEESKNAELYFSHLANIDEAFIFSRADALKNSVEKLRAAADPESDDSLQIMTIHKSKGLEFDTVIIPALDRKGRLADHQLLLWHQRLSDSGENHLLMSSITASGNEKDSIYAYLEMQQAKREAYEACRLLYVACTRAKKRLYLSACLKTSARDSAVLAAPTKNSLLFPVWDALKNQVREHRVDALSELPDKSSDSLRPIQVAPLKRLPAAWQVPELPGKHLLDDYVPFYRHDNPEWPAMWEQNPARKLGSLVHQIFCALNWPTLQAWQHGLPSSARRLWQSQVRSLGIPAAEMSSALAFVERSVTALVQDKKVHWLFSPQHSLRQAEYALSIIDEGQAKNIILDLLLVDGDCAWIIDYKTSSPNPSQELEMFLQAEMENYREIMRCYRRAVENLGYDKVKCALYFPLLARWVEYAE